MDKESKKIRSMFNNISHRYDFLNHFFSANVDRIWRKKTVQSLEGERVERILDVACGTLDLAVDFAKKFPDADIIGVDFAEKMLERGLKKIKGKKIYPFHADGSKLPFKDNTFDVVSIAFGIRNFEDMEKGLQEFRRVLKPGGVLLVLEFTPNKNPFFNFYTGYLMPFLAKIFMSDGNSYKYLHKSVKEFPNGEEFKKIIEKQGFRDVKFFRLPFGISLLHKGYKK
ncbi:ubiquinone/menaquinone biosynthesis methyltransferase [Thermotomaculum hydrothermale]|uniref:Demethylmenaquinone methyltransferase n=1 Tax=Thermotomaculum hydrothermale TaxID=981385 RepID=A0A7R6SYN4_9BACT|nr:bifunctional demethylmenaquinone methyltransferase/2-methoxy-6-polyprenyl-1,4-benzoquinol methylase UbiE [Thermotomaculum hydrothermale]BBB32761.1 ubiquinone/menaquinone biosynthesis methyltransferase [Thermotomaculum hydrothermale]